MPAVQSVTRTLGHQCMGFLDNLSAYLCSNGETKRTQLAMLGRYENEAGFSAGLLRSGLSDQFIDKRVELQNPETGKIEEIILSYLQRDCTTAVTSGATDVTATDDCTPCTLGTIDDYNEVKIDTSTLNTYCRKVSFKRSEWIQRCEDPESGMMRRLIKAVDALLQEADTALVGEVIAAAGANNNHLTLPDCTIPDETLIAEYQTIDIVDANRVPIWAGWEQFLQDLAVNEMNDCPVAVLFGQTGGYATYQRANGYMCCNDLGVDIQQVINGSSFVAPFMSRTVEQAFLTPLALTPASATTAALVVHPSAIHPLEIFKYRHNAFVDGQSMGMVWTDPRSGESFDLKIYFDSCEEYVTMTLSKHISVFTAPTDMYNAACDHLCNQNGIMLYNFT